MRFVTCKEPPKQLSGRKIAIIGAGPAGLTAAGILVCKGHSIDVYDMLPEPGGLLVFGIPTIRMPKDKIMEGINELERFGVRFILGKIIGKDIPFDRILSEYDAVVIATGAWKEVQPDVPGANARGVHLALDFLLKVALVERGHLERDKLPKVGRRVIIIGGGNTAIDAAITSRHYGAEEVIIAYRRTREHMPAHETEIRTAEKAGVKFMFLVSPTRVIPDASESVKAIELEEMTLGEPDASGRPQPVPTGRKTTIECDTVIFAIGQKPTPPFDDPGKYGIKVDSAGRIIVDENYATTRPGVFAIGDVVTGPKDIASAIKAAKVAAEAVDRYLAVMPR
ncbi:MAG: FAD-dependent oxidoreductase [Crenarchaeota archaeon]|nr:FAD-dependent oxidoreductase [Thermoproteota archaeon]